MSELAAQSVDLPVVSVVRLWSSTVRPLVEHVELQSVGSVHTQRQPASKKDDVVIADDVFPACWLCVHPDAINPA
jgi:adenine/guanine phosphoribosyltransferase-like PRPP-binding protein